MEEVATSFFSGSVPFTPNVTSSFAPSLMECIDFKVLSTDTQPKDGVMNSIWVVLKNSPFKMVLTSRSPQVDFNKIKFDAILTYDNDSNREVGYSKKKPLEFKPTLLENGAKLECEFRISTLTSQREDLLFRVKVRGEDPNTGEPIQGLVCISQPIRVVSKPDHAKTKTSKQPVPSPSVQTFNSGAASMMGKTSQASMSPASMLTQAATSALQHTVLMSQSQNSNKKKSGAELVLEMVQRIKAQQDEQQKIIDQLLEQQMRAASTPAVASASAAKRVKVDNDGADASGNQKKKMAVPDFETSFANLLRTFIATDDMEKAEAIRTILRQLKGSDTSLLTEILDFFVSEGSTLEQAKGLNEIAGDGCSCLDCPYKQTHQSLYAAMETQVFDENSIPH